MEKIFRWSFYLLAFYLSGMFSSCSSTKKNSGDEIPKCISNMIDTFKSEVKQNPPRSVTQYTWKGRTVYYVPSPCCDQFNPVYDSACNYLGAPDGGFTGKGDGKLPNFRNEVSNEKLIWKDER